MCCCWLLSKVKFRENRQFNTYSTANGKQSQERSPYHQSNGSTLWMHPSYLCFNCSPSPPGDLGSLFAISPYGKLLQQRQCKMLSNGLCDLANHDWRFHPHTSDEKKLPIGTQSCNLLVTSSLRFDKVDGPCVGATTVNFDLQNKTDSLLCTNWKAVQWNILSCKT